MFVVDTNVLLYAVDADSEFHAPCRNLIEEARGNLIHNLHTATLMREHGIARIVTRDTDFHRFGFLEVVDPLRTA